MRAKTADEVPCGSATKYERWGCRCTPCGEAKAEKQRRWRDQGDNRQVENARRRARRAQGKAN